MSDKIGGFNKAGFFGGMMKTIAAKLEGTYLGRKISQLTTGGKTDDLAGKIGSKPSGGRQVGKATTLPQDGGVPIPGQRSSNRTTLQTPERRTKVMIDQLQKNVKFAPGEAVIIRDSKTGICRTITPLGAMKHDNLTLAKAYVSGTGLKEKMATEEKKEAITVANFDRELDEKQAVVFSPKKGVHQLVYKKGGEIHVEKFGSRDEARIAGAKQGINILGEESTQEVLREVFQ